MGVEVGGYEKGARQGPPPPLQLQPLVVQKRVLTMTEKIELDVQTKAFMEKLKEFQTAEGCVNDFEAILVPYVKDSLVNMIRGDGVF